MTVLITEHAILRARQRLGWNIVALNRMAQRAFDEGVTHAEATGPLRRWIDGLYLARHRANNVRLYGEHAFLFAHSSLMTIIGIPKNLNPIVRKLVAKKLSTRQDSSVQETKTENP